MFKKLKNKKGFTLVELIVVLVILAILAALLVPALTGYIDKAREQSLISEGSMVLTAAQATVSEAYGTNDIVASKNATTGKFTGAVEFGKKVDKTQLANQINQLAEKKTDAHWSFSVKVEDKNATYKKIVVDTLVYTDGTNTIVYNGGNWGSTQKGKNLTNATTPDGYKYLLKDDGTTSTT